jgi:transposase
MMAGVRRSARQPGKSDALDALAVARAAWREPDLPAAQLDRPSRQVRLLVDDRDDLVAERTSIQSRIRWHLHELAPELEIAPRTLKLQHVIERVADYLASIDGLIAAIARKLLDRLRELNRRINELEREIKPLVATLAPALLAIPGCGVLTAAKIVGETAGVARFRSKSAYARWNGTAPQPASSGNTIRFRLNRRGNRQVNAALHRIALTQARTCQQGRDYIARRIRHGNTKTEATPPPPSPTLRRRLPHPPHRRPCRPPPCRHQSQQRLDIGARLDTRSSCGAVARALLHSPGRSGPGRGGRGPLLVLLLCQEIDRNL